MQTVNILIIIDVALASSQQNLSSCVYMVDTNRYLGSNGEGGDELQTVCVNGQSLVWSVASIDPNLPIAISGFTSNNDGNYPPAVPGMINPQLFPGTGGQWGATVTEAQSEAQYSITLLVGDAKTPMSFDPFLTATNPQ